MVDGEPAFSGGRDCLIRIDSCNGAIDKLDENLYYYDATCNSCHITMCPTGASPECCA